MEIGTSHYHEKEKIKLPDLSMKSSSNNYALVTIIMMNKKAKNKLKSNNTQTTKMSKKLFLKSPLK